MAGVCRLRRPLRLYHSSMLVLASQSPRRQEILRAAGIPFVVRPSAIDEPPSEGQLPENYVTRLAAAKAAALKCSEDELVLAADTVVVVDHHILGKPRDPDDAASMLRLLSARDHLVMTGICLQRGNRRLLDLETTRVRFAALSEGEILDYVASAEPMDKAGAYAIQGLACKFVERVEGCYFNVVGLPIARVYRLLKTLG